MNKEEKKLAADIQRDIEAEWYLFWKKVLSNNPYLVGNEAAKLDPFMRCAFFSGYKSGGEKAVKMSEKGVKSIIKKHFND